MVNILGLLRDKYKARRILKGFWKPDHDLELYTRDVLIRIKITPTAKALVYINLETIKENLSNHWKK